MRYRESALHGITTFSCLCSHVGVIDIRRRPTGFSFIIN